MTQRIAGWIAGIVLAALLALLGVQTWRLHVAQLAVQTTKTDLAYARAEADQRRADAERSAREADERYRAAEQEFNRREQESQRARAQALAVKDRALAASRADNSRMRHQLAAYAAGPARGGDAPADSLDACRARAAALGDVLAQSLQLQAELAGAAEHHLADARWLLERAQHTDRMLELARGAPR